MRANSRPNALPPLGYDGPQPIPNNVMVLSFPPPPVYPTVRTQPVPARLSSSIGSSDPPVQRVQLAHQTPSQSMASPSRNNSFQPRASGSMPPMKPQSPNPAHHPPPGPSQLVQLSSFEQRPPSNPSAGRTYIRHGSAASQPPATYAPATTAAGRLSSGVEPFPPHAIAAMNASYTAPPSRETPTYTSPPSREAQRSRPTSAASVRSALRTADTQGAQSLGQSLGASGQRAGGGGGGGVGAFPPANVVSLSSSHHVPHPDDVSLHDSYLDRQNGYAAGGAGTAAGTTITDPYSTVHRTAQTSAAAGRFGGHPGAQAGQQTGEPMYPADPNAPGVGPSKMSTPHDGALVQSTRDGTRLDVTHDPVAAAAIAAEEASDALRMWAAVPVDTWSVDHVVGWLSEDLGVPRTHILSLACRVHGVDGAALIGLTDADWMEVGVAEVGVRRRVVAAVEALRRRVDVVDPYRWGVEEVARWAATSVLPIEGLGGGGTASAPGAGAGADGVDGSVSTPPAANLTVTTMHVVAALLYSHGVDGRALAVLRSDDLKEIGGPFTCSPAGGLAAGGAGEAAAPLLLTAPPPVAAASDAPSLPSPPPAGTHTNNTTTGVPAAVIRALVLRARDNLFTPPVGARPILRPAVGTSSETGGGAGGDSVRQQQQQQQPVLVPFNDWTAADVAAYAAECGVWITGTDDADGADYAGDVNDAAVGVAAPLGSIIETDGSPTGAGDDDGPLSPAPAAVPAAQSRGARGPWARRWPQWLNGPVAAALDGAELEDALLQEFGATGGAGGVAGDDADDDSAVAAAAADAAALAGPLAALFSDAMRGVDVAAMRHAAAVAAVTDAEAHARRLLCESEATMHDAMAVAALRDHEDIVHGARAEERRRRAALEDCSAAEAAARYAILIEERDAWDTAAQRFAAKANEMERKEEELRATEPREAAARDEIESNEIVAFAAICQAVDDDRDMVAAAIQRRLSRERDACVAAEARLRADVVEEEQRERSALQWRISNAISRLEEIIAATAAATAALMRAEGANRDDVLRAETESFAIIERSSARRRLVAAAVSTAHQAAVTGLMREYEESRRYGVGVEATERQWGQAHELTERETLARAAVDGDEQADRTALAAAAAAARAECERHTESRDALTRAVARQDKQVRRWARASDATFAAAAGPLRIADVPGLNPLFYATADAIETSTAADSAVGAAGGAAGSSAAAAAPGGGGAAAGDCMDAEASTAVGGGNPRVHAQQRRVQQQAASANRLYKGIGPLTGDGADVVRDCCIDKRRAVEIRTAETEARRAFIASGYGDIAFAATHQHQLQHRAQEQQ